MNPSRFLTILLVVAIVALHAVPLMAQGRPPTLVETGEVTRMEFKDQITLVGRTEPRIDSRIVAEISGRVVSIDAPEGEAVSRGASLVSIDPQRITFSLRAKEGEVKEARAQMELNALALKRTQELFKQDLVPQSTLDSARASAAAAEGRFAQLDAQRRQLALDLENCTIRAPYDGYTSRRLINVGEWVSPGTPVFGMVDLSRIIIQVDLPERYYGQLETGSPVAVKVSNDSARVIAGTVTGIVRNATLETHTFPVIVTVDNPAGRLGGGALVRATLTLNNTFTSLAVSKDAIVRQGDRTMLYTISEGKAAPLPVRTSSTRGDMVAIEGRGLSEGLTVVVRGNERIFPGSPVRVAAADSSGSAALPDTTVGATEN